MIRTLLCILLACSLGLAPCSVSASAGDVDTTFGTGGRVTTDFSGNADFASSVVVQPDGHIITGGFATGAGRDFALARYTPNGTLDNTFGSGGIVVDALSQSDDQIGSIKLLPDGKIICAGTLFTDATGFDFVLTRYTPEGKPDVTFGSNGTVTTDFGESSDDICFALALQPDGKMVVVGRRVSLRNQDSDFALARYNADGSLDMSFGTAGKVTTDFFGQFDFARDVALQADGQIVAAGQASPNGSANFALARYNADGSLDMTFGTGGKVITIFEGGGIGSSAANALKLQPDGKIVISGEAFNFSLGNPDFALARYDSGGNLDSTFGSGGTVVMDFADSQDIATSLFIQPDGKIIAAGEVQDITTFLSDFGLVRYNSDGSPDPTFGNGGVVTSDFGLAIAAALAMSVQTDGKIIAVGVGSSSPDFAQADFLVARYEGDAVTGSISPAGAFFSSTGGEGAVDITAPGNLSWTAISNDDWITITSTDTGAGNGSITYAVRENFSPSPRQGTATIAGSTFVVTQDGNAGSSCLFKISPAFDTFNATGGTGIVNVTTEEACAWSAVSGVDWITITSHCCGIGSSAVTYTVAANPGVSGRSGLIMVARQNILVKQKGS